MPLRPSLPLGGALGGGGGRGNPSFFLRAGSLPNLSCSQRYVFTLFFSKATFSLSHISVASGLSYTHIVSSLLTPRLPNTLVSTLDARSLALMPTT